MAAHVAHASSVILALAGPMRGVGPADPMRDFGSLWAVAVGLNVINTIVVLYYLVRIWTQKERSIG